MDHSIYGVFESIIFLVFSIEVIYFFNIEPSSPIFVHLRHDGL